MDLSEYKKYLIETRRYFHKHPEIGFDVKNTLKYINNELIEFGFSTFIEYGGLIGILKNENGNTIGIRSDVDALGIPDLTNTVYTSIYEKRNHACGHDAHMAMLLGMCKYISKNKDCFKGTLKVIFQVAEEGPLPGGASYLSLSKHLEDVDSFFALHIMSDYPINKVVCRKGPLMAAVDIININVYGKSSHVANPQLGYNPIIVLPELLNELNDIITDANNLLGITQVCCGETHNVISDRCLIRGSLRTFNEEQRQEIKNIIHKICKDLSIKHNTKIDLNIESGYPSVYNDEILYQSYKELVIKNFGEDNFVEMLKPSMLAEDFSYYQQRAKGIMAYIGTKNEDKNIIYPNHHYQFDIDEDVLLTGMKLHLLTVMNYLN